METPKPFDQRLIPIDILPAIAELSCELLWISDLQHSKDIFISSPKNNEKFGLPINPSRFDWTRLIHEEDRDRITSAFTKILADTSIKTFQQEYRIKGNDRYYTICESL